MVSLLAVGLFGPFGVDLQHNDSIFNDEAGGGCLESITRNVDYGGVRCWLLVHDELIQPAAAPRHLHNSAVQLSARCLSLPAWHAIGPSRV